MTEASFYKPSKIPLKIKRAIVKQDKRSEANLKLVDELDKCVKALIYLT